MSFECEKLRSNFAKAKLTRRRSITGKSLLLCVQNLMPLLRVAQNTLPLNRYSAMIYFLLFEEVAILFSLKKSHLQVVPNQR